MIWNMHSNHIQFSIGFVYLRAILIMIIVFDKLNWKHLTLIFYNNYRIPIDMLLFAHYKLY